MQRTCSQCIQKHRFLCVCTHVSTLMWGFRHSMGQEDRVTCGSSYLHMALSCASFACLPQAIVASGLQTIKTTSPFNTAGQLSILMASVTRACPSCVPPSQVPSLCCNVKGVAEHVCCQAMLKGVMCHVVSRLLVLYMPKNSTISPSSLSSPGSRCLGT
jgi:hypothetical protein